MKLICSIRSGPLPSCMERNRFVSSARMTGDHRMTPEAAAAAAARPRIEGDREQEILDAAIQVLAEVGYDRLTMDAVAAKAKASKATLYRRWTSKVSLVIEALQHEKGPNTPPDTGSLRGDLQQVFCGAGGLTDQHTVAQFASVLTAIARDPEF